MRLLGDFDGGTGRGPAHHESRVLVSLHRQESAVPGEYQRLPWSCRRHHWGG